MLSLPADVLCLIFSQLVQNDQLECMTVCRQWHNTILYRTLFRVIYIDCQEQLKTLIEIVKKDPLIGAKVDSLNIYLKLKGGINDRIFNELFPNLRELKVFKYGDIKPSMEPFKQHETQGWRERMEKITEYGCDRNTYGLLQSGVCERLTAISVNGQGNKSGRDFIKALINAPALKVLTLKGYYLYTQDLELLHSVLPSLESLSLIGIFFDGTDFPRDIKPATALKSFQSDSTDLEDFDEANLFAQYISQKYTHLEEIKMEICEMFYDIDGSIEAATQHRSIITSHLKTLGPKLKTFIMDFYIMDYKFSDGFQFDILDECKCQLKRLELRTSLEMDMLEQLSMTAQAQYIQSLIVDKIVQVDVDGMSLDWLGRFRELKELELHFPLYFPPTNRCQVSLTELFGILENTRLESLALHSVVVGFSDVIIAPVYPWLKSLTFVEAYLKQNTDVFISHSFPNLKQLTLNHCSWEGKTLMLSNLDLSYLELANFYEENKCYVLVITLGNNQQRLYTVARKKSVLKSYTSGARKNDSTYPYIPSKPYDASQEIPTLTIVCRSLHSFSILNTIG